MHKNIILRLIDYYIILRKNKYVTYFKEEYNNITRGLRYYFTEEYNSITRGLRYYFTEEYNSISWGLRYYFT